MKIKVIAIGNILMGDDSIGIRVLEQIESSLREQGIETIIGETDFQYCISVTEEKDFLFVLDAAMLRKPLGTVTVIPLEESKHFEKGTTQHCDSFLDLIYTYYKEVKGYIIGIEVNRVEYGLGISEGLQQALNSISLKIKDIILESLTD